MHGILKIEKTWLEKKYTNKKIQFNAPSYVTLRLNKVLRLIDDLNQILEYFNHQIFVSFCVIDCKFIRIIPKSQRILSIFKTAKNKVIGARYLHDDNSYEKICHIYTYMFEKNEIEDAIQRLIEIKDVFIKNNIDTITAEMLNTKNFVSSSIRKGCIECYLIDRFERHICVDNVDKDSILITMLETGVDYKSIFSKIDLKIGYDNLVRDNVFRLTKSQYDIVMKNIPYLVSTGISDTKEFLDKFNTSVSKEQKDIYSINDPSDEGIIGVIDTVFDNNVYFSSWVDYRKEVEIPNEELTSYDYEHGTGVTSIIVDGPTLNPLLQDFCGRFRVRHFGVAYGKKFSSSFIMNKIEQIVSTNLDIKVWNLSLGSDDEISKNFISYEGALLDELQNKYDIIFVIAGTNDNARTGKMRIGAPADSLNSIVVNSVNNNGKKASYFRSGPVLVFFNKPDISYYGGDVKNENYDGIQVCIGKNNYRICEGTSYAAPWITRKIAYLMYVMNFNREEAKALIVHSATSFEKNKDIRDYIGYGIVPKDINEILSSKNNEIKLLVSGSCSKYRMSVMDIPVPIDDKKQYYKAKATLCYFAHGNRNRGADYTDDELDLHIGRMIGHDDVDHIDNNYQCDGEIHISEKRARMEYGKWNTIKHIGSIIKQKSRGTAVKNEGHWGIILYSHNRDNDSHDKTKIRFAIVITLNEIQNKDRYDEFIQNCKNLNWNIYEISVQNSIEIHNQGQENIVWE